MRSFEDYPLLPETEMEGFTYGAITAVGESPMQGAGVLQGPGGLRAGLQWEVTDAPYIARVEGPGPDHWGVYRVGFTQPVRTIADLVANLARVLPKLKILYSRARVH